MADVDGSAFALLHRLEQRGREHDAGLPPPEEAATDAWTGVGFRLSGQHFLSRMQEIRELLKYPELASVPRTRRWVRGMANVRGTLLPVMDLNAYLGRNPTSLTRASRVLVVQCEGLYTGLLVDEVFGMRQFQNEVWDESPPRLDGPLENYVEGAFRHGGEHWLLFSMAALLRDPDFLRVAC